MIEEYMDLAEKVVGWAGDRNLIEGSTASNQFIKLVEEVQEIKEAKESGDELELLKEIGDYHVVSIIMLSQLGIYDSLGSRAVYSSDDWIDILGSIAQSLSKKRLSPKNTIIAGMNNANQYLPDGKDPVDALRVSFEKIKDRKGKMIDGVFVKEADLNE